VVRLTPTITISKHKKMRDQWVLIMNDQEHNHPPAVDPFSLQPHLHRRPGRQEALRIAETHCGVVSYADSKGILKKIGLEIGTRLLHGFYALSRAPLMIGRIPKEVRNVLRKCTVPRRLAVALTASLTVGS
jgi:hypothetical protein